MGYEEKERKNCFPRVCTCAGVCERVCDHIRTRERFIHRLRDFASKVKEVTVQ